MMYKFMTLDDHTEIVHSDTYIEDNVKTVINLSDYQKKSDQFTPLTAFFLFSIFKPFPSLQHIHIPQQPIHNFHPAIHQHN